MREEIPFAVRWQRSFALWPIVFGHIWSDGIWARLYLNGMGFILKHRSEQPMFSERIGKARYWPKWPTRWRVRFLRTWNDA